MSRTFRPGEARDFYDRFASLQDLSGLVEHRALEDLVRHADFGSARRVVELGCGSGRLARRLLERELPPEATWLGLDLSPVMVRRAAMHLEPFGDRARVRLVDGSLPLPLPAGGCDRFVLAYVLDLLGNAMQRELLDEAWRLLAPGGRLCVASLGRGEGAAGRAVCRLWEGLHALHPALVGGCRPVGIAPLLAPAAWTTSHHRRVTSWAITTEVLIAERV